MFVSVFVSSETLNCWV